MSGWYGPYIEKLKGKTPWKGTYAVQSDDCEENPPPIFDGQARDIWLEFENMCYADIWSSECGMGENTALRIDASVDDGDLTTGEYRVCNSQGTTNWCGCTGSDTLWVIVHNAW